MRLDHRLTRRGVLRAGGMTAALLAMARLRAVPALGTTAPRAADAPFHVLSPTDARVLSAIAGRITFTGDASMPRFADTAGLQVIDGALRQLPADVAQQLSWALLLFDYGPPLWIGKLSAFTGLSDEWQDAYITSWADSRFQTCRIAFQAFKNLSMLGYYSQDATWPAIHYGGPWAPKPRRVMRDDA